MTDATLASLTSEPRRVHVEAQADHLESLSRAKTINALAELIWNALDADADLVSIVVIDNELGTPIEIRVIDNGSGINLNDAESAFGNLGGSWKRDRQATVRLKKRMHGRDGKGRFKAFALGHQVLWETVYEDSGLSRQYRIRGNASNLQEFEISVPTNVSATTPRGTSVHISAIQERLSVLASDGPAATQLAEVFAIYLRDYPGTRIMFRGKRVDPTAVQKSSMSLELPSFTTPDGKPIRAQLDVIEWTFTKKERKLCLCDAEGYSLHEIEAGIRPGAEYNFTAYLRSDLIAQLHEQNALALEELNPEILRLASDARDRLRAYFRRRKAETVAELVKQWKSEGIYPFSGDPSDVVEKARREVFDICALNVNEYLDSFREGLSKDRKFTLRMLKTALDENPEALKKVLTEVLDLPREKQNELADLLESTTLSSIIAATRTVTERLKFLAGLQELLFQPESKKTVKERSQLHRMLEGETWIFGEEFLLTSSDENLNTVLGKHIKLLRPPEKGSRRALKPRVLRDDGTQGVIDLLLAREVPSYAQPRREYLVVELKRPSQKIDLTVKAQIESYALAVANDERFDSKNTFWTFLAVSNEITLEAQKTIRQLGKPVGFFHEDSRVRIGLATWAEVINASRMRLDGFRAKLDYMATRDEGVALLHAKYKKYLPDSFAAVDFATAPAS